MNYQEVPCETCLGSGKRKICIDDNQVALPLSVLIKAGQLFKKCTVEESFDGDGFVLRLDMRGTYEEVVEKQEGFHNWLSENYPDEVARKIVLTINRVFLKGK